MSNPRRGWLAAGLIAAVTLPMGAGWNLAAYAQEIPAPPVAAVEAEPVPPPLLPWGERPSKLKVAAPGLSSAEVAAAGADAAPADADTSPEPDPVYAPKGLAPATGLDAPAPPTPPGTPRKDSDPYFLYAGGEQLAPTDGTWANFHIAKPELAAADAHTLTEIAMHSEDGKHVVEVGWTVDRRVNGDEDPHLFVFYWKDEKKGCYNGCGYEPYSQASIKPGATLPTGEPKRFGIQHKDSLWWIAYNSEFIGYFPDELWDKKFTKGHKTQWFGEIAAATPETCTDMGNGLTVENGSAARVGTITTFTNPEQPPVPVPAQARLFVQPPQQSSVYGVQRRSDSTFRYGGPGTGPCTSAARP